MEQLVNWLDVCQRTGLISKCRCPHASTGKDSDMSCTIMTIIAAWECTLSSFIVAILACATARHLNLEQLLHSWVTEK